jgi:hypothetical protein
LNRLVVVEISKYKDAGFRSNSPHLYPAQTTVVGLASAEVRDNQDLLAYLLTLGMQVSKS